MEASATIFFIRSFSTEPGNERISRINLSYTRQFKKILILCLADKRGTVAAPAELSLANDSKQEFGLGITWFE